MAQGKKSIIIYCDLIHTMEHLSIKQRGEVFTWLLEYANDKNPDDLKGLLGAVVEPIKQQMKRDLRKWEKRCETNRLNGAKGGRPKKPKKTERLISKPKKADNDNDNDNDIIKEIEQRKAEFKNSLSIFLDNYNPDLLNDFFLYWTEHNPKGKKMRFEMAKNQPFDIKRRLQTWNRNQKNWQKEKPKLLIEQMKQDYGISN